MGMLEFNIPRPEDNVVCSEELALSFVVAAEWEGKDVSEAEPDKNNSLRNRSREPCELLINGYANCSVFLFFTQNRVLRSWGKNFFGLDSDPRVEGVRLVELASMSEIPVSRSSWSEGFLVEHVEVRHPAEPSTDISFLRK
jgi:hypothetical protein